MLARRVPGVVIPNILWIAHGEPRHQQVASDFGQDGCARDAEAARISVNDRGVRNRKRAHHLTIYHNVIRPYAQAAERSLHREHARLVDVDAVYLTHRGGAEGEGDCTLSYLDGEAEALLVRQPLRVVHTSDSAGIGRHYDRASQHRASDRTSADLIDTSEHRTFLGSEVPLDGGPALPPRHVPAAGLFRIRVWSFGGRLGGARFDLVLHACSTLWER